MRSAMKTVMTLARQFETANPGQYLTRDLSAPTAKCNKASLVKY